MEFSTVNVICLAAQNSSACVSALALSPVIELCACPDRDVSNAIEISSNGHKVHSFLWDKGHRV